MKRPKDWIPGSLNDLIQEINAGNSVNSEDRQKRPDEIGILKTSCLTAGVFNPDEHKAILREEEQKVRLTPKAGNIIVSRMNTPQLVGASAYVPEDYDDVFLPDRLWQVIVKKNVNPKWLAYVISSSHYRYLIGATATGTSNSMKNISQENFLALPILIPPKKDQDCIAKILSAWDEAIAKTQSLIEKKEELKKTFYRRAFSRTEFSCKIGDIAEIKTGGTPSRSESRYWENGNIPWMSSGEVNKRYVYATKEFITEEGFRRSNTSLFPVDTIMIAMNGQGKTRGTVALLKIESTCNQSLAGILPNPESFDSEFLYYFLDSRYQEIRNVTGDDGRNGLNLNLIRSIPVCLPELSEQRKIAHLLSMIDQDITLYSRLKSLYQEQKQGLMQNLLTGEWPVNVEEDADERQTALA